MSKKEKLIYRFLSLPKDFTYDELDVLLKYFGFEAEKGGKTTGSAIKYKHSDTGVRIYLHKPHPGNFLKKYILIQVMDLLRKEGYLDEK